MPVNTPHREYVDERDRWLRCRTVYGGSDAVKAAGSLYLPTPPGWLDTDYEPYKTRANFYNAMARTVQGLVGVAFQKPPDLSIPEAVEPHMEDITLDGTPMIDLAMGIVEEVLKVGRYGVLLDMPAQPEGLETVRPYWVPFTAEQIVNWRVEQVSGDTILTRVILKATIERPDPQDHFLTDCIDQYRVHELVAGAELGARQYQVSVYEKAPNAGERDEFMQIGPTLVPTRRGVALDEIPFVIFSPSGITVRVEKAPLLDLVDVNLSHYRTSADLEWGRHWTALPIIVVSGQKLEGKIHVGGSEALNLPDPAAKAYILEYTGQGLGSLREALEEKEKQMSILGARLLEGQTTQTEAAETVRMRHAGDAAVLQTIVGAVSLGLTQLLRWHCWWFGLDVEDADIKATLNSDFFSSTLTMAEVRDAVLAFQAGGVAFETFYGWLQAGGRTRIGVTAEEEKQDIDAEQEIEAAQQQEELDADAARQAAIAADTARAAAEARGGQPPKPGPFS